MDENFSQHVANGLDSFERVSNELTVVGTRAAFGTGATDETIVRGMTKESDVLLTKDTDFKKEKLLTAIIVNERIGAFILKPAGGMKYWAEVELLWKYWGQIRGIVLKDRPPYLYEIRPRSIKKIGLI